MNTEHPKAAADCHLLLLTQADTHFTVARSLEG